MNKFVIILAAVIVSLGTLCAIQWSRLKARQQQTSVLASDLEQKSKQLEDLSAAQERAEEQKRKLLRLTDDLTAQVNTQRSTPAATPIAAVPVTNTDASSSTNAGGLGGMLGKLMSDPNTKKFIRNQQRMMMDQLYKPLVKQLGMTPDEANAFKDLLADGMMKSAEKATSLLGGGSQTDRAQAAAEIAADQKSADEQIKALLGDERFALFKSYQETAGERMQLNMFRQQNDSGEYPLNDLQVEQLLGFMKDEKANVASALNQSSPDHQAAAMDAMLSEEKTEQLMQSQEAANQRVYERARSVLSPDQLRGFGEFQTNQLQMMRMGMSMARKLMAPGTDTATPATAGGQ